MLRNVTIFALFLLAPWGARDSVAQALEMSLARAVVVVEVGEASYVHYTVQELRQQIKEGRLPNADGVEGT